MISIKRFMRGALSGAFFFCYGLFALPFAIILPLIPSKYIGRLMVRIFYKLFVFFARVTRLYSVKADPFPSGISGGRIIVMNHLSLIDICVLLSHIPDAICIAKASIKQNPFLSMVVKKLFLSNDKGIEELMSEAKNYLDKGIHIVIFPQGTRGGKKIHRGAARCALGLSTDILVYNISYDPIVLSKNQPWWDVGARMINIRLSFKKVIKVSGKNDYSNAVALTKQISESIGNL